MDVPLPHTNPDGDLRWLGSENNEYTAVPFTLMFMQVFPSTKKQHLGRMRKEFVTRHALHVRGRNTTSFICFRRFIEEHIHELGPVNTEDKLCFERDSSMPMGVYFETSNRRLQTMAWYARLYRTTL
jgi:hypothetical protein